jgi:hypothetical protein
MAATTAAQNADGYVFARNSAEYERLRAQARHWEKATRSTLDEVGVGLGALDVGCGPGEVMRLLGARRPEWLRHRFGQRREDRRRGPCRAQYVRVRPASLRRSGFDESGCCRGRPLRPGVCTAGSVPHAQSSGKPRQALVLGEARRNLVRHGL